MNNITFRFGEGAVELPLRSIDGAGELTLIPQVKNTVANITTSDTDSKEHSPFPEGLEKAQLPHIVQTSWKQVQVYLSPEKQSKISYYEKNGEWYINLDGTKISLQNETATHAPHLGFNIINGNTYFSQSAAAKQAIRKEGSLPSLDLWIKMAEFLGGLKQLKDILQIPLVGWLDPEVGMRYVGGFTKVWSAVAGQYIEFNSNGGDVYRTGITHYGLSVRLLDTSA